ncbi:T9SS type A sorting domain-containing protein [Aureispira sp. CCB-E]|uniref:T9SS type A sorting domain-containing protein n=1 Tax=Aureispira sp. CCB-E TaxID=3051121 RepID=UPI0028683E04|nr:T9SS type A sorting domain-containing protein [Aureispira sp. CCB-E]WMX12504.1 T9SS type A sorting domain-containing protein [Aureispira sp. CCB-E]
MKTQIKIQLLLLLFMSTWSMAQVTVKLRNISPTSGGATISECGEIDLGSSSTSTYHCEVYMEKPFNHALGDTDLYIYIENSFGIRFQVENKWILGSSFIGSISPQVSSIMFPFTLQASTFSTGDKLIAVLKTLTGVEYRSCEYTLKKGATSTPPSTPSFSLSPTSKTITCGTTSSVSFSVTETNNVSGSVSYEWNVGSGWATTAGVPVSGLITTTSRTLTLVPNTYPLSNISVVPIFKGNRQRSLHCQVSISPFTSTARIVGNSAVCSASNAVYTMTGLQNGETVNWTVSNPSLVTISNATNSQVTLTGVGQGDVFLTGTITNSCSQTIVKRMKVGVGVPVIIKPNCGGLVLTPIDQFPSDNSYCDLCRSNNFYADKNMIEAEATGGHNLTWDWDQQTTNFTWTTQQHRARFLPYQMGTIRFRVRAQNVCGWSSWYDQRINITQECDNDDDNVFGFAERSNISSLNSSKATLDYFTAYPNPASTIINLELADQSHTPNKKATVSAELFDFYGFPKAKILMDNYNGQIDVSRLPRGTYILKVSVDGNVESHQIVVE